MEVVETCGKGTLSSGEPSNKRSILSIYDDEVVGFEKDAEIIMKKLTRGTKERDVISIFGMPGLGKTTLARKVYNNPAIINYFDVRAWCAVSQAYNRRTLLIEIFKQVTSDENEITEDADIPDMLRKSLIGRRYLIVLDDIWDVDAWEDLGICFPEGESGSRVMVTTRIEEVAKHLQPHSVPYSLSFLTSEESWELLEKKVFRGESCPLDLLEAGLQVALHCKGLPLVVVLVAGIISKMEREASLWLEVANDLSSLALGEQSMKVIQLSYDHLDDHLKPCLLYMGLFPEDHKIPVYDLLKLWMAEELKTFRGIRIRVYDTTPRYWWRFPNIEGLCFHIDNLPSRPLFPSVEIHTRLQSLDLVINPQGFWDSVGWESYFVFPSNLRHLRIIGCFLTDEMVLNIARLKMLESLRLDGGFPWQGTEYHCWDVTNVEFPALKYLALHFVRMDEWKASEESFPVLEELSIRCGYYYKEIPPSFADIPTLRLIKLYDYDDSLGVSAMNIKKEIEENTGCDTLQLLLLTA